LTRVGLMVNLHSNSVSGARVVSDHTSKLLWFHGMLPVVTSHTCTDHLAYIRSCRRYIRINFSYSLLIRHARRRGTSYLLGRASIFSLALETRKLHFLWPVGCNDSPKSITVPRDGMGSLSCVRSYPAISMVQGLCQYAV
jgi:hypothetical protein